MLASIRWLGFAAMLAVGISLSCSDPTEVSTYDAASGRPAFSGESEGLERAAGAQREARAPCASRSPLRRPFFGDLHVHTTYSQDASTQDTRVTPRQAYQFALGRHWASSPTTSSETQVAQSRSTAHWISLQSRITPSSLVKYTSARRLDSKATTPWCAGCIEPGRVSHSS